MFQAPLYKFLSVINERKVEREMMKKMGRRQMSENTRMISKEIKKKEKMPLRKQY